MAAGKCLVLTRETNRALSPGPYRSGLDVRSFIWRFHMSRLRSVWGWFRGGKRRPIRTRVPAFRFRPTVELLAERVLPAVTATFANGVLTVTGDELDNSIAVSRDAAGTLVVNGDGLIVPVQGGTATAANTTLIR